MAKYYMMTLSPIIAVAAGAVINNKTIFSPAIILFCFLLIIWTVVEEKGVFEKNVIPDETDRITMISRIGWLISIFISSKDYHSGNNAFLYVQATGFILFAAGIYIRHVSMKELKGFFSYSLKTDEKHKLVSSGIYKHLRHPSYSGMIMLSLAMPLIFTSLTGLIFISLSTIPNILLRIKSEEKILTDGLGEEYINYIKTTKKLIPYIY
jgi:protein-S-isoprenylcysteine O-methyltransferase Ste14